MLHTRTGIEYRAGIAATIPPTILDVDRFAEESNERRSRSRVVAERVIDEVLADSFPASDPPSWNPGIVRPTPGVRLGCPAQRSEGIADAGPPTGASYSIDVSRPSGDLTFLQGVVSFAGGAGIALLVPVAILLVGLPIALSVRGVLELVGWLFGVSTR
jgi:hypothetical protein